MKTILLSLGAALSLAGPLALPAADTNPPIGLKLIAEGFTAPTVLVPHDGMPGHLLVADQVGTVHLLGPDGKAKEQLFLDLRDRLAKLNEGFDERGVLGLALHPRFKENRKLYVYYSAPRRAECPPDWDHTSHLSEFKVSADNPGQVDPASERLLLQIDEPQMNHNCGRLAFGPDGYLYIGTGDGGAANDEALGHSPQGNGQDLSTLLGKILRIDIDQEKTYKVPPDNPLVGRDQVRPEIYAYGFRNPWGITFDRGGNRELFAADVGQNAFEEVNIVRKGGNYGWRLREGFHGFDPKNPNKPPEETPAKGADGQPLLDPILEYKNFRAFPRDPDAKGISVTGGLVYRGKELPQLTGRYIFADWSRNWALPDGALFMATRSGSGESASWKMEALPLASPADGKVKAYIVAFGHDSQGEIYVLTSGRNSLTGQTGKVFKLGPI